MFDKRLLLKTFPSSVPLAFVKQTDLDRFTSSTMSRVRLLLNISSFKHFVSYQSGKWDWIGMEKRWIELHTIFPQTVHPSPYRFAIVFLALCFLSTHMPVDLLHACYHPSCYISNWKRFSTHQWDISILQTNRFYLHYISNIFNIVHVRIKRLPARIVVSKRNQNNWCCYLYVCALLYVESVKHKNYLITQCNRIGRQKQKNQQRKAWAKFNI